MIRSCLLRLITLAVVSLPLLFVLAVVSAHFKSERVALVQIVFAQHAPVPTASPVQRLVVAGPGLSILGGPSLSAHYIDSVLTGASSPAAGTGQALYALSQQYGIDDAYALAVFEKESSFGKAGAAFHTHALGNIICAGYPTCYGRFRLYPSWEAGYEDFYRLLVHEYVARGLDTVEKITPVYAPSVENDVSLYISNVCSFMRAFRRGQSQTI